MTTSALIFACSSSQRRRSSSRRSLRSAPRLVVGREAARVHPHGVAAAAGLEGGDAGRHPVEQLAVVADEQDGLRGLHEPILQPPLRGHVEVVVGLVEEEHLVGSAQQRLEHHPLLLAARQGRAPCATAPARRGCRARRPCRRPTASPTRSRRRPPSRRAPGRSRAGPARSRAPSSPAPCASISAAAPRTGCGETETRRSRTVVSSRTLPMNCRMTPSPPLRVTAPSDAVRSPASIRSSVVFPVPLGPMSATFAPSPTRNVTSRSSAPAVGQREAHGVDVEVAHGREV